MRSIPCTIHTIRTHREECWILSVPSGSAGNGAASLADLMAGKQKQIILSDRKTDFLVTSGFISFGGRQIAITKNWLECVHRLFSDAHTDHIDFDFSDRNGDVSITVRIT